LPKRTSKDRGVVREGEWGVVVKTLLWPLGWQGERREREYQNVLIPPLIYTQISLLKLKCFSPSNVVFRPLFLFLVDISLYTSVRVNYASVRGQFFDLSDY
jgi:hypothetical protein